MSGRRRDEDEDWAARFCWSDGDVIPLNADEVIAAPGIDQHSGLVCEAGVRAPPALSDDDPPIELADWVEVSMHREAHTAENIEVSEQVLADPANWLHPEERHALISAFETGDRHNLRAKVASLLRSGPSRRMVEVAAALIEHNAFHVKVAGLSTADVELRRRQKRMTQFRSGVLRLLREHYRTEKPAKLERRATAVTAFLFDVRPVVVTDARKATKDPRRGQLADLRIAVEDDPTAE